MTTIVVVGRQRVKNRSVCFGHLLAYKYSFRQPVLRHPQCFVPYGQQNPRVHASQRGVCSCFAKYRSRGTRNMLAFFVHISLPVHDAALNRKRTRCISCRLLDAGCQRTCCKLKFMQKSMLMLHKLLNRMMHLLTLSRASCVICSILLPLAG
jgi:hypothetical protein